MGKDDNAGIGTVSCPDGVTVDEQNGMSHEKVGSVQLVVTSQDNLVDEASGLQVENEELPAFDDRWQQGK